MATPLKGWVQASVGEGPWEAQVASQGMSRNGSVAAPAAALPKMCEDAG